MKLNKLKLSIIAIATMVAGNVNAQTFYQCMPNACPNGQYFDGANCKSLPATHTHTACPNGQYFDGEKCLPFPICDAGYIRYKGKCCQEDYKVTLHSYNLNYYSRTTKKGAKISFIEDGFIYGIQEFSSYIKFDDCVIPNDIGISSHKELCWQCVEPK